MNGTIRKVPNFTLRKVVDGNTNIFIEAVVVKHIYSKWVFFPYKKS